MPSGEGTAGVSANTDWLPTLLQMRDRVASVLRDTELAFISGTDIDTWINEGYLDINARLRLNQKRATGSTASDGTLTFPSDLIEPTQLWIGTTKPVLVDPDVYESYRESGITPYATLARVWAGKFETYPAQASTSYALEYIARPTMLVNDSDQPTALTPELADRVINYARAFAMWKEGQMNDGQLYMQMYLEGLPGKPRVKHRLAPGSMDLIPIPSPFDR